MKNLFFSIAAIAVFTLSSFTIPEYVLDNEEIKTVPCKWRTVTVYPSGNTYYGPWIYGNCEEGLNGNLYPILD